MILTKISNKSCLSLLVVEEDVDHIAVVGEEEDVDHIGVLGEEEEETRVRIFYFCIFFLSNICCFFRFSSAGREMPGETRTTCSAKIFCQ